MKFRLVGGFDMKPLDDHKSSSRIPDKQRLKLMPIEKN